MASLVPVAGGAVESIMKQIAGLLLTMLFSVGATHAYAVSVPTIHQVYAAAHSGHLRQAQQMMNQVLTVHPGSGKAHFVLAEILAAEHRFAAASHELHTAQQLAPGLTFEKQQAVQSLQARIQAGLSGAGSAHNLIGPRATSGVSWVVIALFAFCLILLVALVWALRRPRTMAAAYSGSVSPAANMPGNTINGPFRPMAPYGGGFMSNLKTGLGIGAGMAAGEALVDHFLDGNRTSGVPMMPDQMVSPNNEPMVGGDLGGNDFGINDDSGWSDNGVGGDDFSDMDSGGDDWN